ncbi:MAG: HlyD family efflux transporter periplasmic adaptor subunit [Phycisphaerales bacterium]|jgi:multidrug efflux pump subunit AcrA (membrane-fusion protein)
MVRWITIVLSVTGLAIGVWAVATADEKPVKIPLARPASVNPYLNGVASLGIVEPADRNVAAVAPEPGLITEVFVHVGDHVKEGDPLFRLDTRRLEADLVRADAAVVAAQADVDRWHALPRVEDVPPLEAAVARAEALAKDREDLMNLTRAAVAKGSGSDRDLTATQFAMEAAKAELDRAKAELAKMQAGGWQPDLKIAEAALRQRQAEVSAFKLLIDRLTVRASRAGTVLRREVEPGEFASTDANRASIILGDLDHLAVRAQVDEEDIALVSADARATCRTRGSVVVETPLKFLRIEPYARPKVDITGANLERVDTRVIDVVFELQGPLQVPLYPGQAVDVFIEAAKR